MNEWILWRPEILCPTKRPPAETEGKGQQNITALMYVSVRAACLCMLRANV